MVTEEEAVRGQESERIIRSSQPSLLRSTLAMLLWVGPIYLNVAASVALLLLLSRGLFVSFLLVAAALIALVLVPVNERSSLGRYLAVYYYYCKLLILTGRN